MALCQLPNKISITWRKLMGFMDRGGHFGAKVFVGGVLKAVPDALGFDEAHCNGVPCYHGKSGVDGDGRHAEEMYASLVKTAGRRPDRLYDSAKNLAAGLNARWVVSRAVQARKEPGAAARHYLAVYADLRTTMAGVRHCRLEIPGVRSSYSMRSLLQGGKRVFFDAGNPWDFRDATASAKRLGTEEELAESAHRDVDAKKGKRRPFRRMLNVKDQEAKRRRRDAAAGQGESATYTRWQLRQARSWVTSDCSLHPITGGRSSVSSSKFFANQHVQERGRVPATIVEIPNACRWLIKQNNVRSHRARALPKHLSLQELKPVPTRIKLV